MDDQDQALSAESALTARLQYLGSVSDRLTATMNSADRFVNFAGIIAAATVTVGILGKKPLVAILAPYALIIIFAYQIQLYTDAERYTALLEYLEAQLNDGIRQRIFRTRAILDRAYRKRLSTTIMQVMYGLIMLASLTVSAIKTYMTYGWPWLVVDVVGVTALASLLLGTALLELFKAQEQVETNLASSADTHVAELPVEQPADTHPASP